MAINSSSDLDSVKNMDRDCLLKASSELISQLQGKINKKRFIVTDVDDMKIKYYRVTINALQTHNSILDSKLKDDDLKELQERMDQLEHDLKEGGIMK